MASKDLKGLTIKIGGDTSELLDSLKDVEKKGASLSKELGEINKLLKMDPKNTQLLAQKQKVLAESVGTTKEKLDKLKEAEKQVQEQFKRGEVSEEQVRALQREIVKTEKTLDSYEKGVKETAEQLKKHGKRAKGASEDVDDLADASKDADKASEGLGGALAGAAKAGLAAVGTAVGAVVGGLTAAAEGSREYRTEMGKLDTAFTQNGFSAEAAYGAYSELQGVLGETDQAVEAANHLAQLTDNEKDLATWTGDILPGVYATFGASLPLEGLTEAANETAKVGQVTGSLADALNWASDNNLDFGIGLKENIKFTKLSAAALNKLTPEQKAEYEARKKQYEEIEAYNKQVSEAASVEDKFNIALAACTTEQERQALITETLSALYGDASEAYKDTNAEVIRANEANEAWSKSLAGVGGSIEPIITDVKMLGASMLDELVPGVETLAEAFRGVLGGEEGSAEALGAALSSMISGLLDKIVEMAPTVINVGMSLVTELATSLVSMVPELASAAFELFGGILQGLTEAIPKIVQALTDMLPDMVAALVEGLPLILDGAVELLLAICDAIPILLNALIPQLPTIIMTIVNGLLDNFDDLLEGAIELLLALVQAIPVLIQTLVPLIPDIVEMIVATLIENLPVLLAGAIQLYMALIQAIPTIAFELLKAIPQIIAAIFKGLKSLPAQLGKFFTGAWEGIKKVFAPAGKFFSGIWSSIKKAFSSVTDWFSDIFTEAWQGVKNVFSTGGEIFDGIKEGIASVFTTVVNSIIRGINTVIALPFDTINGILNGIRSIEILDYQPFKDLWKKNPLPVPQIPELAKGGVLEKGQVGLLEGKGAEAVVPLENNKKWLSKVADQLSVLLTDDLGGLGLERSLQARANALTPAVLALEGLPSKLDRIIDAIEAGQILTIDGDALVGATSNRMDGALGRRRVLAARGAI